MRVAACLFAVTLALVVAPAAGATEVSHNTWVPGGVVNAIATDPAGRIYVGGGFDQFGPRLGNAIAVTLASDAPAPNFPDVNGPIRATASDGAGGWFIGGGFTSVGGVARSRLAHIRPDHSLDPDWNPGASKDVRALALSADGASLFAGGDFTGTTAIGGVARQRLAKLSTTGAGAVDPTWAPGASGSVRALVATASTVYVGGSFSSLTDAESGFSGPRLARVAADGKGLVASDWLPGGANGGSQGVNALALSGTTLFAGGDFGGVNLVSRSGLAKVDTTGAGTVDPTWDPSPLGPVNALLLSGSELFAGGSFVNIGGKPIGTLAKLATTGAGAPDETWTPGPYGTVNALALSGDTLIAGGAIQTFGVGVPYRQNLIAFAATGSGAVRSWDPRPDGAVNAIAMSGSELLAGGSFGSAGPLDEYTGSLVRLNPDGTLDTSWEPQVLGAVNALVLDGTTLYVGGNFGKVGPTSSPYLAKVSTVTGAADAGWTPAPVDQVNALALSGGNLYAAGNFAGAASIGGQNRQFLAKVSTSSPATVDPAWDPQVMGLSVTALAVSGSDLFVGGNFAGIGGQSLLRLAKIDAGGTAAADPTWMPEANKDVFALAVSGSNVFAGGDFSFLGTSLRQRLASVPLTGDGTPGNWTPSADGIVRALAVSGDDLYVGGDFGKVTSQNRFHLARLSASTGAVDPSFIPPVSTDGGGISALALAPGRVYAGGSFRGMGSFSVNGIAMFDLTPPSVSVTAPAEGNRFRVGQDVDSVFSCSDPDGAIDPLTCSGPAKVDTAAGGAKTFTATATDVGSNTASQTVNYFVDGSAPAVLITAPQQGATYVTGSKLTAAFECSDDDGSADIASCTGTSPVGSTIDTSQPGAKSFTVTGTDLVGNSTTRTVSYAVLPSAAAVAPLLSLLQLKPVKFKAAPKGSPTSKAPAAKKKLKFGSRVSFKLSVVATVTFKVTKKVKKKTVTVGTFKYKAKRNVNVFVFNGRLKKKLPPGKYTLVAQAINVQGLKSKVVSKPFTIVKG